VISEAFLKYWGKQDWW